MCVCVCVCVCVCKEKRHGDISLIYLFKVFLTILSKYKTKISDVNRFNPSIVKVVSVATNYFNVAETYDFVVAENFCFDFPAACNISNKTKMKQI